MKQVNVSQEGGGTVALWEYEEREMTPAEYAQMQITQEGTAAVLAFNKQAAIDEYTEELLEGGLL